MKSVTKTLHPQLLVKLHSFEDISPVLSGYSSQSCWAEPPAGLRLCVPQCDTGERICLTAWRSWDMTAHDGLVIPIWLSHSYHKTIICVFYQDFSISLMPSPGVFLYISSLCQCGFSPCTLAPSHTPKTRTWGELRILNLAVGLRLSADGCLSFYVALR